MRLDGITRRGLAVFLVGSLVSACASTGAVPRPFPAPGGRPESTFPGPEPADPAAEGYALTSTALALRGAPYRNGGVSPEGFDCSGFVQYVFGRHGVALPRETRDQFRTGQRVDRGQLEPGDLVFFTTVAPGASHVGIMIGGDQFVHAPSERGVVRVERLSNSYWNRRFVGARRPR
ncbi:MAG TPA: C40 family peptidase [Vicinamibacterales bacterium]|nr:C40 family peptidase [Vicinamibacterales bacterium]